jgi:monoamine oxidase
MIQRLVEQFDAADPARASVTAIAEEWSGDTGMEAPASRPEQGYGGLVDWMAKALDPARVTLRLETVVTEIAWSKDGVVVQVEHRGHRESVRARAALITVPLAVLQAPVGEPGAIRFDPPLRNKTGAFEGLATGPVLKVLLRYDHRFWESLDAEAAKDVAFFHWDEVPFRTIWTAYPVRSPWLTAWLAGPRAAELSFETDEVIAARAAESVQWMFRGLVDLTGLLRETRLHNWQRDPRALGAYSYVTVGGTSARQELARPLGGVLFFAGEATEASGEACTVAGALMSGERAAQEILTGKESR